jgi:hypothetical protein
LRLGKNEKEPLGLQFLVSPPCPPRKGLVCYMATGWDVGDGEPGFSPKIFLQFFFSSNFLLDLIVLSFFFSKKNPKNLYSIQLCRALPMFKIVY